MIRRILLTLSLALATPITASAQPQGVARERLAEDPGVRHFLNDLQRAIRTGNRKAVLRMIRYPLRVNDADADGSRATHRVYRNATAVRADYRNIFTAAVRRAIADQRYETLWGNSDGFMIGDGAVWFDRVCLNRACRPAGPVRIISINLNGARVTR